jgi:hypothetical protein
MTHISVTFNNMMVVTSYHNIPMTSSAPGSGWMSTSYINQHTEFLS